MAARRVWVLVLLLGGGTLLVLVHQWPGSGLGPGSGRSPGPRREPGNCRPRDRVALLKTHKCASTSLQNILMRYGWTRELNFVLPREGNYLGRVSRYSRTMLADTAWERAGLQYSIFCLHTRWDKVEVEATLGPGAAYLTMLRDPVELFQSMWEYNELGSVYGTSLEQFALAEKGGRLAERAHGRLGRNMMLWDAGLQEADMDNVTTVTRKIKQLEAEFDLVLMADHWEESMVLLQDLLCWDFTDLVSLKLNGRRKTNSSSAQLSEAARAELQQFLAADYRLYNHFHAQFATRLARLGEARLAAGVVALHRATAELQERCGARPADSAAVPGPYKLWRQQGMVAYTVQSEDPQCGLMAMSELSFIEKLRKSQSERATERLNGLSQD